MASTAKPRRGRGRPPKKPVETIPATAKDIARNIFKAADKNIKRRPCDDLVERAVDSLDAVSERAEKTRGEIEDGIRRPGRKIPL